MRCGIFDLAPGAAADVASDIDDEDLVCHVDLALVHVVQHLFGAFRPDFIISGMAEETDADDDVSLKRQALLGFDELVLEAGAPAKSDDFVFAYHTTNRLFRVEDIGYRTLLQSRSIRVHIEMRFNGSLAGGGP